MSTILTAVSAAAVSALCAEMAMALDSRYFVRRYTVRSRRVPPGGRARIVLIADLHSEPSPRRRRKLALLLREQNPDVILAAGDLVDGYGRRGMDGAAAFLRLIRGCAPVYFSMGNHEGRNEDFEEIRRMVMGSGARLLDREWVRLTVGGVPLVIGGMDDPACPQFCDLRDWRRESVRAFAALKNCGALRVLISHRPDLVGDYLRLPFDLAVSGHAHGGQVRIPGLINGLYCPDQGIFPRYAGGGYRHRGLIHIVSRGLSAFPSRPRVFNPPELVVIDLESAL